MPPHARYLSPDAAVVAWESTEPSATVLEYAAEGGPTKRNEDPSLKTTHRVILGGLEPKTRYAYWIKRTAAGGEDASSGPYELDNALNYTVPPVPAIECLYPPDSLTELYGRAAQHILASAAITKGYCLVLGCNEGRLAYELAKRSELMVLGTDTDNEAVERCRAVLSRAGVYGSRITVHPAVTLADLPFPSSFANLIVSDEMLVGGPLPGTVEEVVRLLQPAGGIACLGYAHATANPGIQDRAEQSLEALPTS